MTEEMNLPIRGSENDLAQDRNTLSATDRNDKLLAFHTPTPYQLRNHRQFQGVFDDNRVFLTKQLSILSHTDLSSFDVIGAVSTNNSLEYSTKTLEERVEQLEDKLRNSGSIEDLYFTALDVSLQATSLKTALRGVGWCVSREFFAYNEEESEIYYDIRNKSSALAGKSYELRRENVASVLNIGEIKSAIVQVEPTVENLLKLSSLLEEIITRHIKNKLPHHPDQQTLAKMMIHDLITSLQSMDDFHAKDKAKLGLVTLPLRFESWLRHKEYSRVNTNYTGGGVENISISDELLGLGSEDPLRIAREILEADVFSRLIDPIDSRAKEVFLTEIGYIYESRNAIFDILEAALGNSELLLPSEAMKLVSELTHAMDQQDLDELMSVVDKLENREIDLYHVTPNRAAFRTILGSGNLRSAWADHRYGDTFFGGGLYFWGAQQEDWLKGGEDAIHIRMKAGELFLIQNKYNNINKTNPLSLMMYDASRYPHPQKKNNILAMLPAEGVIIHEHSEVVNKPLNNEGYSAQSLETIESFEIAEADFLWRCDKHYAQYDTEYTISPIKEELIKSYLGENVVFERGVTSVGFLGGEYDRLIIPRSVSPLRATSLAYSLRIAEVVYEDKLSNLKMNEATRREDLISFYAQSVEGWNPEGWETQKYINERLDVIPGLSPLDRVLVRYFFKEKTQASEQLFQEKTRLVEALGGDWPKQTDLENYAPKPEYFLRDSTMHGTPHIMRVFLNSEFIARLVVRDTQTLGDYNFDLEALRIAIKLHDTRRKNDSSADYKHGQRAADFSDGLVELDGIDRDKAKRIMINHCLDDYEDMLPEEFVMKDSDALDRWRFRSGPDFRFFRTPFANEIQICSLHMALLSAFFLENGYKRKDSVIKAALALELVEPKGEEDIFSEIDYLLLQSREIIGAQESTFVLPEDHPHNDLFDEIDELLKQSREVIEQFEQRIERMDFVEQRKLVLETENELDLQKLLKIAEGKDTHERRIIRTLIASKTRNPETIKLIYEHSTNFEKSLLAANPATPTELLIEMGDSQEKEIVDRVARNPATPEVLKRRLRKT